ncbi:glutamyl-tRNA reductase [Tenggerimyces flavus]|uniref:Glutamyl-tRNA reductase n=1 Tax=Tenggerimyces flavus TaxID=1708749 RepID=A0ABV7Y4R7_9ACTN|nr:glutamyl-tRNA reductase [Tenggerimyces flavus]MBM7791265.1 glutamyl-tRNA reductase [Tenggerimyces flavus]
MSVLVVGVSHRSAPIELLERVAAPRDGFDKLLADAAASTHVGEAALLASCNRVEVYAEVSRFHGGVEELSELLASHSGVPLTELTPHLYVRYEDGAVSHLLSVVCGLDSLVVGESQILGQVKKSLRQAQDAETIGPELNGLFQHALRVGKRAQTETELGRAGASIVGAALDYASRQLGGLVERTVLVVGAGSMAALAASTAFRAHQANVVVANRTPEHAVRLAGNVGGRAVPMSDLPAAAAGADVLVSCTGAVGTVIEADLIRAAATGRPADQPLVVLDLAMPRDVDEAVGTLPGVALLDLARLAEALADEGRTDDIEAVRAIVAEEAAAYAASRRAATAAPTVTALRTMAASVVEAELQRLAVRVPDLPPGERAEVEKTVRRVVDKLLHVPTTRVKELAEQPVGTSYTDALRELFALDPNAVDALTDPQIPETQSVQPNEGETS